MYISLLHPEQTGMDGIAVNQVDQQSQYKAAKATLPRQSNSECNSKQCQHERSYR